MKRSWNSITLSFLFFFTFNFPDGFVAPTRHLCHPEQSDAILQLKNEFEIQEPCLSFIPSSSYMFPMESWTNNSDCCSWDGIRCDADSGDVIELKLNYSCLHGQLNSKSNIFRLQNLRLLDLSNNIFSGEIPSSLGNLSHLTTLLLYSNHFSGEIPSSLGNLSHLSTLDLTTNNFNGQIPSSLGNLSHLTALDLSHNHFNGEIPSSLGNLSNLKDLFLSWNHLSGKIPASFGKLSHLTTLDLSENNFSGKIPSSLGNLSHLTTLDLSYNHFSGKIPSPLTSLQYVDLSNNTFIGFESSIRMAPRTQHEGMGLDISNNNMKGQVPGWLWKLPNLHYVDFSNNNFTGFERSTKPRSSIIYLSGANNNFMGKIPSFICALRSLTILDLSNNKFSGSIPLCLGNFSRTLIALNLRKNHLSGGLPENISASVKTLDIGHNQLVGKLPRSLAHISFLEVLNVERNKINDVFPFWLSSLQELQVLVLRSNAFHGPIHQAGFSKLRIIDISSNHFYGTLPSDCFANWTAMLSLGKNEDQSDEKYIGGGYYFDSMVLMNKGVEMKLERILKIYTALDFSRNKFEGEIPKSIGLLKELHVLNLSNNAFSGHIPSTMANLIELESLDVCQNNLSGEIPQELGKLSFLSYMNFSHNQLVGLVPGGTQFRRQPCSSFWDNLRLYGPSLDEVCVDIHSKTSHQSVTPEPEKDEEEVISWIAAAIGFIPGIAFGLMMGYIYIRLL